MATVDDKLISLKSLRKAFEYIKGLISSKVSKSGDEMTGDLSIYPEDESSLTRFQVNRKVGDSKAGASLSVSQDGAAIVRYIEDSTEYNRLTLDSTKTSLSRPLNVQSGGTGATTSKAAQYNLLKDMVKGDSAIADADTFVGVYTSPNETNGAVYQKPFSVVWNYIKSKIEAQIIRIAKSTNTLDRLVIGQYNGQPKNGGRFYIAFYTGNGNERTELQVNQNNINVQHFDSNGNLASGGFQLKP